MSARSRRRRYTSVEFEAASALSRPASMVSAAASTSACSNHLHLVDLSDVPDFSVAARGCMEHTLEAALSTTKGRLVWRNLFCLLRAYASEPDWAFPDTLGNLYQVHFPEMRTDLERDFLGGALRSVIRQLQEWVDSWFDPTGAVRVRLRHSPLPANKLRGGLHIKYRLGRREKAQLRHGFDADEDVEGVQQCVRLPAAPPHVPSAFADGIRLNIFTLLLMHFPHDGLELKQIHQAYQVMFGSLINFGKQFQTTAEAVVTDWMADVLSCKKVSPLHDIVRLRLDAPELFVDESVLREYCLVDEYARARQRAADVAESASCPKRCGAGESLLAELLELPCMRRSTAVDEPLRRPESACTVTPRGSPKRASAPPPPRQSVDGACTSAAEQSVDKAQAFVSDVSPSEMAAELRRLMPKRPSSRSVDATPVCGAAPAVAPISSVMQRLRQSVRLRSEGAAPALVATLQSARALLTGPSVGADWPASRHPSPSTATAQVERPTARRPLTTEVSWQHAPIAEMSHSYADVMREEQQQCSERPIPTQGLSTLSSSPAVNDAPSLPVNLAATEAAQLATAQDARSPTPGTPVPVPPCYGQPSPLAYRQYLPGLQQIGQVSPVGQTPPLPPTPLRNWDTLPGAAGIRLANEMLLDSLLLEAPQRSLSWSVIAKIFADTKLQNYLWSVVMSRPHKFSVENSPESGVKVTLLQK